MRKVALFAVAAVMAVGFALPAHADAALQAILDAQQQQQQANLVAGLSGVQPYCSTYGTCPAAVSFPNQQASLGLSGVQPYCVTYGTCPAPPSAPASNVGQPAPGYGLDLGKIFAGLFDPAPQPTAASPVAPPDTTHPVAGHRHHRWHHMAQ